MIAADQWRAYNEAVEEIRRDAAEAVEREVSDWIAEEWDGDVASAREAAQRIMASQVAEHDRRAAALAAEWYDAQGREAGSRLDRAVTAVTYTKHDVDNLARYQATKLAGDTPDVAEFARMCGEFAANDAMRSLNGTILRNAKRDRAKGVRFARVTSGRNTCAFCLMLAGRGAVYHTRKTAGEFDHWHRHCTCKVVPCFSGNPHEVLVEGHDPAKIESRLKQVEAMTGTERGTREFSREVALRDPDWLLGDEVGTDYSLNPRENYGTLLTPGDYSPGGIVNRGNEWRDLWVHHALERAGIKPVVHGKQDIDMTINGEWWEVKSPDEPKSPPGPGNELSFIESNLRKASRQFKKRGLGSAHVVFSPKYRDGPSESDMLAEVRKRMKQHRISEVLYVKADGSILRLT